MTENEQQISLHSFLRHGVCFVNVLFPYTQLTIVQNPLDMFPRCFPVDGEVANLLRSRYGEATGKLV